MMKWRSQVLPDGEMIEDKKIIAIIQARMTSSRLPGKVMKDIAGHPMIFHVVNRVRESNLIDQMIIATTTEQTDNEIVSFCHDNQIACFRGHPFDVLDRFYHAALENNADVIVRITADCPLMDANLIDELLQDFFVSGVDFAANRLPPPWKRSYPIGLDIEIATFSALERAWQEAESTFEREHVMPYLYDQPGRFKVLVKHHDPDYGARRLTVDTPQDLEFVRKIFDHFSPSVDFSWLDVMDYLNANSHLESINAMINAKNVRDIDNRFSEGKK